MFTKTIRPSGGHNHRYRSCAPFPFVSGFAPPLSSWAACVMSDLRDCRRSQRSLHVSDTESWRRLLGLGVAIQTDPGQASGKQVPGWPQDRDTVRRQGRANRWRGRAELRELNGPWDGGRLLTIEGAAWWRNVVVHTKFLVSSPTSTATWTVWSFGCGLVRPSPWLRWILLRLLFLA